MAIERRIARIVTVPPLSPGFAGPGHLATPVLTPGTVAQTDPFIRLMDDHLDMGERQVGGPHPHAGFETVTLILDGALYDADEGGRLHAGEVQWMTAGRGIVHGENVKTLGHARVLQLWLILPRPERWTEPAFQDVRADSIPVRREPGVEVRVYSGASAGLKSQTRNHVPVTMVEMTLNSRASVKQELPATYNGFVFVIEGAVQVGSASLQKGQVGWFDRPAGEGDSVVRIAAGDSGARLVMYAGQPQGTEIVAHGPFIGDSQEDIRRLYAEYRAGRFVHMSALAAASR